MGHARVPQAKCCLQEPYRSRDQEALWARGEPNQSTAYPAAVDLKSPQGVGSPGWIPITEKRNRRVLCRYWGAISGNEERRTFGFSHAIYRLYPFGHLPHYRRGRPRRVLVISSEYGRGNGPYHEETHVIAQFKEGERAGRSEAGWLDGGGNSVSGSNNYPASPHSGAARLIADLEFFDGRLGIGRGDDPEPVSCIRHTITFGMQPIGGKEAATSNGWSVEWATIAG
jgi:hypothetical protein